MKAPKEKAPVVSKEVTLRVTLTNNQSFDGRLARPSVDASGKTQWATIAQQFTQGNFSCDCNLSLFLARHRDKPELKRPCGNTLKVKQIIAIEPEGEVVVYQEGKKKC